GRFARADQVGQVAVLARDGEGVGQVAGVLQDAQLAAVGDLVVLHRDLVRAHVVAGGVARLVVLVPRVLGGVLVVDAGELQQVVVGDVPVQLGDGLRAGVLGREAGQRAVGVGAGVPALDQGEEEQPVLDDRTAGVGRVDRGLRGVVAAIDVQRVGRIRIHLLDVLAGLAAPLRRPLDAAAEVPLVGTGLGQQADDATQRTAVLGAVTAGLD